MKVKKIFAIALIASLTVSTVNPVETKKQVKAKETEVEKEYVIVTETHKDMLELEGEYNLDNNECKTVSTAELTEDEAEDIVQNNSSVIVEEDVVVSGSKKVGVSGKKNEEVINWNMQMINADNIKKSKKSKNKVKVAIIDSGVDFSSDIDVYERKNFVPNEDEISILYEDGSGHGTNVAGIIAAKDNEQGITGVNEKVELYSAKVLDGNNQAPISRVIQAIDWAIEKEVNIINLSLGMSKYSAALHEAIKRADEKGILIISAAGNGGAVEYPAAYEETLAVGSIGADGKISEDSSIGNEVDVVAPGEQILSTSAFEGVIASSGTSMAAPHVTGIASVLWQKDKNVSADFIRDLICESAKNVGERKRYGNGVVDLEFALEHFDEALKNYDGSYNQSAIKEDNTEEVESFDEVGVLEARWLQKDHEKLGDTANSIAGGLTKTQLRILKKGLVAQDIHLGYVGNEGEAREKQTRKYRPFHGYDNYVNAYEYLMEMALKCKKSGLTKAKQISYINNNASDVADCKNIKNAITTTLMKKVLKKETYNKTNIAIVLMGMAMHVVSDAYSHRSYVPGSPYWKHINHNNGAHTTTTAIGKKRFKAAGYALGEVLAIWNGNCPPSFEEYDLIGIYNHSKSFRLMNYNAYASRCENGIYYNSYKSNVKKLSCKYVSSGKGLPE